VFILSLLSSTYFGLAAPCPWSQQYVFMHCLYIFIVKPFKKKTDDVSMQSTCLYACLSVLSTFLLLFLLHTLFSSSVVGFVLSCLFIAACIEFEDKCEDYCFWGCETIHVSQKLS